MLKEFKIIDSVHPKEVEKQLTAYSSKGYQLEYFQITNDGHPKYFCLLSRPQEDPDVCPVCGSDSFFDNRDI